MRHRWLVILLIILLLTSASQAQESTPDPATQALVMPTATATASPTATVSSAAGASPTAVLSPTAVSGTSYTVRAGDTLFRIARRFGLTIAQIAAANGITNTSLIYAGQTLIIPTSAAATPAPTQTRPAASATPAPTQTRPAASATPAAAGSTYTVVGGDTLFRIAARFNTTVSVLVQLNNLANPNLIFAGQVLRLPAAGSAPAATPSASSSTSSSTVPAQSLPDVTFARGIEVFIAGQDVNALATQVVQLGVDWVKIVVNWRELEQTKGMIDFAALDAAIEAFGAADRRVLLTLTGAPDWARPSATSYTLQLQQYGPPDNVADFGTFAGIVAERYAGRVQAYEIWTEPNLRRSWIDPATAPPVQPGSPPRTGLAAVRYIDLLKAGRDAIKAADAAALVISAGLAPTGWNDRVNAIDDRLFLSDLFDQGLAELVDAIGVQPDGFANPPDAVCCTVSPGVDSHFDNDRFYFQGTINAYRAIASENGAAGVPLWVTRFGWGTAEGNALAAPDANFAFMEYNSPAEQATYIVRAFEIGEATGFIGGMFLYNLNGCQVGNGEACFYSLVDSSNAARPAFVAIQSRTAAAPRAEATSEATPEAAN